MKKISKHIEIVRSSKAALSSMGQQYCSMVVAVLEKQYARVGITVVNDSHDLERLVALNPDLVFLGVKQVPDSGSSSFLNKKIWVADFLDEHGIAYTGSPASAIALDFDKSAAKTVVASAGLLTADFFTARPNEYAAENQLPLSLPLFVKPLCAGGGQGIGPESVVRTFEQYSKAVENIYSNFSKDALVETYLEGREFSVALLQEVGTEKIAAMPVELIAVTNSSGDRILGRCVKKADSEEVVAVIGGKLRRDLEELALQIYNALGARDYGRIDIRLDSSGTPYFLEANLIPGLHNRTSYFTKAWGIHTGLDYHDMILRVVAVAFERTLAEQTLFKNDDNIQPEYLVLSPAS